MKNWRDDFATIALFTCIGPFVGMVVYGVIVDGLSGLLAPLGFMALMALTRTIGLLAFLTFGVAPALLSAGAGVLARRSGHPSLFIPATIFGGLLAIFFVQLALGIQSGRNLYLTAFVTSASLALLDLSIRRWSRLD